MAEQGHRKISTPKELEALKPSERDYEVFDAGAPGLCIRVTKLGKNGKGGGSKVFRWYVNSIGRRITIGHWAMKATPSSGFITLNQARKALEDLKAAHVAGRLDEELAAHEAKYITKRAMHVAAAADATGPTLKEVADDFLKHIERRRKRPDEVRRTIEKELVPVLGSRPITSITPKEIRGVVEGVVDRGAATQAGKVLAHAKQLFRFAQGRDDTSSNPAAPLDADALGVVNNICQRVLSPDEIKSFWYALPKSGMTPTVRTGLKIILITGVRSCELLRAKWADVAFDDATWVIPVGNQKLSRKQETKARPFVVPLTSRAVELFKYLHTIAEGSPWVMATPHPDPDMPAAPITEKALVAGMRKMFEGEKPLLTFAGERPTPHDLRRTLRTGLGKLGVPWNVAERSLNHSLGRIGDTYDVGDYLADRRAALEKWDAYLQKLLAPEESKLAFLDVGGWK